MDRLHVDLICRSTAGTDGIRDHTVLLGRSLASLPNTSARAHDLRHLEDTRDLLGLLRRHPHPTVINRHVVILQYNPGSFAPHGAPWWLPRTVQRLRRACPHVEVVLLVHELWVRMNSMVTTAIGLAQRAVFGILRTLSDLVVVSTDSLVRPAGLLSGRPIGVLPVGSNLPDAREAREPTRRTLGVLPAQPIVAAFGTGHPSRLLAHLGCAIDAVTDENPSVVLLNLGAAAPEVPGSRSPALVITPGHLPARTLAQYVATVDLLLLPFSDGVATRRTTVMAGLQHGVPILGTDGVSTSTDLRASGALALVDARAPASAYAQRACELLTDAAERTRLGLAGRALYENRFAWPKLARQLVTLIETTPRRSQDRSLMRLGQARGDHDRGPLYLEGERHDEERERRSLG